MKRWIIIAAADVLTAAIIYALIPSQKIDFNTQVKPLINKKCIACHGGVKRESDFSLLFRQDAMVKAESGKLAIIPGNASGSELVRRINSHDPEERMPYKKDPLTKEEIRILTDWINEGAEWGDHWAYQSVKKQELPESTDWTKNDVDRFIIEKLSDEDLKPSNEANKTDR